MSAAPAIPPRLVRSRHLSWFAHMGAVYLFHDLYGYLMEMSPDIADLIQAFDGGADIAAVTAQFADQFEGNAPQMIETLQAHAVLFEPDEDELEGLWAFVPIKGKWNIWQRRPERSGLTEREAPPNGGAAPIERLTLWTAWGERPVQQLFLDPAETLMWDAFDGTKRLNELRALHDPAKLLALVRRLVHSDVQALKLSIMPWAAYAARPAMAPPYLSSTMPYARWAPGLPVPAAVDLTAYHQHDVVDADAQFDHTETTLSHLLRVPHPALAGRTYGETLVDVLIARGLVQTGAIRVLEIGAGLGYVARDVIARLRAAGRTVDYTICELAPALEAAQRARIGPDTAGVRWISGDVLAANLPDASFDLILANEMVGDLPARKLSRPDLGLSIDGTGTVDRAALRALATPGAILAADLGIVLDDAPEPFYLQVGAIELVAKIAGWLAPGGTAMISEFGDISAWPKLSTQLDHPELSTHFGILVQVARALRLDAKMEFIIDVLDVDREQKGLATTRSQFRALRALATDAGIELPKIGFTPALLEAAFGEKLALAQVGDLRFDRFEDRLMGLVPHEFKAILARKPLAD